MVLFSHYRVKLFVLDIKMTMAKSDLSRLFPGVQFDAPRELLLETVF